MRLAVSNVKRSTSSQPGAVMMRLAAITSSLTRCSMPP